MASSFVLKDTGGKPVGYLQQIGDKIRCRIHANIQQAEMMLLYSPEEWVQSILSGNGEECEWESGSKTLIGACLMKQGQLFSSTGDEVRRRYLHFACKKGKTEPVLEKQTSVEGFPERRWPPPPCVPGAKYVSGAWKTE